MLFKASTVLFLLAITCPQSTSAQNIVETTILNAVDTLNRLFTGAVDTITEQLKTIASTISDQSKIAVTNINNGITNLLDQVGKLEQTAASAGRDVSQCTINVAQQLRGIGDRGIQTVNNCYQDTQYNIANTFDESKVELQEVSLIGQRLLDDFRNCQNILCRGAFIFRAGAETASNTVKTGTLIAKTLAKLAVNSAQGVGCLATATLDTTSEASGLLKTVTECASNIS